MRMKTTATPVKPGIRERRRDEAAKLVTRLIGQREETIAKLVKLEGKLIDARRALARCEKRIALEKAKAKPKAKRGIGSVLAEVAPPEPPKKSGAVEHFRELAAEGAKAASAPLPPADAAARAARLRAELQEERGRRRHRAETPAG